MTESDAHSIEQPEWVNITGGQFQMGSPDFYADEAPQHERSVADFQLSATPITNAQFAEFVEATGYITVAERALDASKFVHLTPLERAPGSLVFTPTSGPVNLRDWRQWWAWVPGAQWRHPLGPDSDVVGKDSHPVVQVAYSDAVAYADWAGARLPTETEHEFASAGGALPAPYAWGQERDPAGVVMANTWHGSFPYLNTGSNGWVGTSPVGTFPPNGYGLYDCIGNVWEWTSDYYSASHQLHGTDGEKRNLESHLCGCSPQDDLRASESAEPESIVPRRVLKGGSHLCAPEYCLRYRPSARSPQAEDSSTSHIGFRCVRRDA